LLSYRLLIPAVCASGPLASLSGATPYVRPPGERGRWSSRPTIGVVLRVLRGEDLDALSRGLGVTARTITQWREQFLAGGPAAKSRPPSATTS